MKWVLRIGGGVLLLLLVLVTGAAFWFWFTPVGLNNYLNKALVQYSFQSPELVTGLGLIDGTVFDRHSGRLDDHTPEGEAQRAALLRDIRDGLDRYGPEGLTEEDALTWHHAAFVLDDFISHLTDDIRPYEIDHLRSVPAVLPQFLADVHVIKNDKTAKNYIKRLEEVDRVLGEVALRFEEDAARGHMPPAFIIDKSIALFESFSQDDAAAHPFIVTLPARLEEAGIEGEAAQLYLAKAERAVREEVVPAYRRLIALLEDRRPQASPMAGILDLPQGGAIYEAALESFTTTDLSAEEIHALGLAEVARIEAVLDPLLAAQGLAEGSTGDRLRRLADDPARQFEDTAEARAAVVADLQALNDALMEKAPEFFEFIPPQPVVVTPVPPYEQDTAILAYYSTPALDGSRPGRFYINLRDPAELPLFDMPTLVYHEGAPGHHFQFAYAQKLEGVPLMRKVWNNSGYAEGWGLYAEWIAAHDFKMYDDDPLGLIGQLRYEMWRAARLVIDTGLHAKGWSREEGIAYMQDKAGATYGAAETEIDRYVVTPGQATSYKVGELTIRRLRAEAEAALGEDFDLARFHTVILGEGAMPLFLLEEQVHAWIEAEKAGAQAG